MTFFGIIILKKNQNVYAKIYYKLPLQILIFWYLWQIGLTNICLIETLDKYLILRYDENCGSCFAAEQFVDIKLWHNAGGNEYEYETEMAGTFWNVDSI